MYLYIISNNIIPNKMFLDAIINNNIILVKENGKCLNGLK